MLAHRSVGHGRLRVLEREIPSVLDKSYDLILGFGIVWLRGCTECFAKRVDAEEECFGENLVDDGHFGGRFAVVVVEVAPREYGRVEWGEDPGLTQVNFDS